MKVPAVECCCCWRIAFVVARINSPHRGFRMHQNAKMATKTNNSSSTVGASAVQFGYIPEFNGDTDDWSVYQEILEEYFKANSVVDTNRVSALISVIGADTYRMLRDLCHPDSPKDKSYAELCAMLAKQFMPEIAVFRERSKFYRAEQCRGEDVKSWYARLKKLSVNCKFGEYLEPLLLDKFITGMAPGPVQDRLCEEKETLTLKDALDLAANKESAMQNEEIVEDLVDLTLDERRRGRGKHGGRHRHHHHHHGGHHGPRHGPHHHGRPGPPGRHGFEFMEFGRHGPPHGPHHHPHGPIGPRFGPHVGGPPGHFPDFRGFRGEMAAHGCPFKMRGRHMKRWEKMWRKHARRSCSTSSSSTSSSSSSSGSDDEQEKGGRKCHRGEHHKKAGGHKHGGQGRFGHRGHGGPPGSMCPREERGHGGRCRRGRKEQVESNMEPTATENTEPELIE